MWKQQLLTYSLLFIYPGPLTQLTMQYYLKSLKVMELSVQISPGSEVSCQIGNSAYKSLITAKTIHEILRVEYSRAPFLKQCFF